MGGQRRRLSSGRAVLTPLKVNTASNQQAAKKILEKETVLEEESLTSKSSAQIAEMYQTAIKMASENKITAKNAWTLSLIDHMLEVVEDDDHLVNFQRASCTLEAGVKIYCGRVDETFESTHRVLESLARRQPNQEDAHESIDDGSLENNDKNKTTKNKLKHPIATIADDVTKINRTAIDDVIFKPLALADATAAKDMVLQRLSCQRPAAVLLEYYGFDHSENRHDGSNAWRVDLPALPAALCPELSALRVEVAAALGDTSITPTPAPPQEDFPAETLHLTANLTANVSDNKDDSSSPLLNTECDEEISVSRAQDNSLSSVAVEENMETPEVDFDDDPPPPIFAEDDGISDDPLQDAFAPADDGLDYFAPVEYVGFEHWLPRPAEPVKSTIKPNQVEAKKTISKKVPSKEHATKSSVHALFDGPPPAPSALTGAKNLRKRPDAKRSLTLPLAGPTFTSRDLTSLFLAPGWCVKPVDFNHANSTDESTRIAKNRYDNFKDIFEAHVEPPLEPHFEDSPFDCVDFDDDDMGPPTNLDDSSFEPTFLACDRRVEVEQVPFTKTAKRVDVRKLKSNLWARIANQTQPLPFSTAVSDVAESAHYDTNHVTMPFFFTCLLHLCNDHNLALSEISPPNNNNLPPLADFLIHNPIDNVWRLSFLCFTNYKRK